MKSTTKKLNVHTCVMNTRSIFVKFLPPTNNKGPRIKLMDKYNDVGSKTFPCIDTSSDILQQAVDILHRNGANIICRSSIPDFFIINITNWGSDDEGLKIKDLK